MKLARLDALTLELLVLLTNCSAEAQWTQFRGPNGCGVDDGTGYPVEFTPAKNVVWRAVVPYGQSSPVLAGGRVYLTASEGDRLPTMSLDARSGKELWRREIRRERAHKGYPANDPASPTPAVDATGVVAFFADFGLVAYAANGKEQWRLLLGPFKNFYGMAASPVIAGDLVVLVCDQESGSFMIALDRATGKQRWRTERKGSTMGWATPMVYRPATGPAELILLGTARLDSYFLATGEARWWMPVASWGGLGTPLASGDTIFISTFGSSQPVMAPFDSVLSKYDKDKDGRLSQPEFKDDPALGGHFVWLDMDEDGWVSAQEWNERHKELMGGEYGAVALKPGNAKGKLDASAVQWCVKRNLPFVPAPLLYQGVYYMARSGGIITSLNPLTGQLLKEGRTREALGVYYASPVAADGKIYLASEEGKMTVLKAGAQWEILSVNDLGEEIHATPALSEGRIYVRTRGSLYCFGNK